MAKEIKLLNKTLEKNGAKEEFDYRTYIERILDSTPQGGFSLADVRLCNRIQKQIDLSEDTLVLEEQHWNYLKKKVEGYKWGAPHPIVEEFCDAILKAETVKIEKAGEA